MLPMMPTPPLITIAFMASARRRGDDGAISRGPRIGHEDRAVVGQEQVLRVQRDPVHDGGEVER
jgi:hypothetical protein